jgi:hypothetical protein
MDVARFILALTVLIGGGFMVYINAMSAETVVAVIGVVLGFYFGSATSSTVTKAATTAATDAVTRSLEERGIK